MFDIWFVHNSSVIEVSSLSSLQKNQSSKTNTPINTVSTITRLDTFSFHPLEQYLA